MKTGKRTPKTTTTDTMSSFNSFPPTVNMVLLLLLLITYLPSPAFSQNQTILPSGPTLRCLLPLAPCAPFVRGVAASPTQLCCDNLRQVNDQQPRCVCLLLNNTASSAGLAINNTLAMQLPSTCSVHVDRFSCSGAPSPSLPPTPHVSFGSTTNSTNAVFYYFHLSTTTYGQGTTNKQAACATSSPMVGILPRTGIIGVRESYGMKLKSNISLQLLMVVVLATVSSTFIST